MAVKKVEYTTEQKIEVLDYYSVCGNKSQTAKHFNLNRGTLYEWIDREQEIRKLAYGNEVMLNKAERLEIEGEVTQGLENYKQELDRFADKAKRKELLGNQVEAILIKSVKMLERHPDMYELSAKDLADMLVKINGLKKDLYDEPTVVIEYRNRMMGDVIKILLMLLSDDRILSLEPNEIVREFTKRMEAVEADYEII